LLLLSLAAVILGAGAFGGIQYATAGAGPAAGPPAGPHETSNGALTNRKLKSTSFAFQEDGLTVPPGTYTAAHPVVTMNCPSRPGHCTIAAAMYTEFQPNVQGDEWATCLLVDGSLSTEPGCPWVDTNADAGEFQTRVFAQNRSNLAPGPHTVQTLIYSVNGGTAALRNYDYRLYTP
jgi:hypothetical protein